MGVLGGYLYWKVILEFWFGHPKCHLPGVTGLGKSPKCCQFFWDIPLNTKHTYRRTVWHKDGSIMYLVELSLSVTMELSYHGHQNWQRFTGVRSFQAMMCYVANHHNEIEDHRELLIIIVKDCGHYKIDKVAGQHYRWQHPFFWKKNVLIFCQSVAIDLCEAIFWSIEANLLFSTEGQNEYRLVYT